jgi:hypothetical protein
MIPGGRLGHSKENHFYMFILEQFDNMIQLSNVAPGPSVESCGAKMIVVVILYERLELNAYSGKQKRVNDRNCKFYNLRGF